MSEHLSSLWNSFVESGTVDACSEVIIVNDGSTDNTKAVLDEIQKNDELAKNKLKIINLEKNENRFWARLRGAQAACSEQLLFLDTRVILTKDFGANLARLSKQYTSIVGFVDLDVTKSVFNLYWDRSHKAIFFRNYKDKTPIRLTYENYDKYLKGTTVFLCLKHVFIDSCKKFDVVDLLSDDTFLMKEYVKVDPITIHPELRILWNPRQDTYSFLKRLWDRGPQFVEYHVFGVRGTFFWIMMLACACLIAWIILLFSNTFLALQIFSFCLILTYLSTALIAKTLTEFLRLAPLHVGVVMAYGFGAVRGIIINVLRKLKGEI